MLAAAPRGLAENEATPYVADDEDSSTAAAIAAVKGGRNGVDAWILQARALEHAGYLPGDVLMVDLNSEPHDGDVVCAQIYDLRGRAETVFRIFERPYLVAATLDRTHFKPIYVDERVSIRGVVINLIRPRLSRLAS